MMKTVIIDGKLVILDKIAFESDEMLYDRITFILKNYKKLNLDILIAFSKIYLNVKYKQCVYSDEIMEQLNKLTY